MFLCFSFSFFLALPPLPHPLILAKWSKYTHIHRECAMHFVTSNKQRDLARQQGTTSHCTDICGCWGVRLVSSVSSLHFGRWTWPRLVPRITQGASTLYRNDLAIQEVVCTWLQNSEMDMGHRSTVNFVQLGVEIPDSFWNSVMNTRKGLWPHTCRNRGFESHRGHGYLSVVSVVCCQVEVSATSCAASLCVI